MKRSLVVAAAVGGLMTAGVLRLVEHRRPADAGEGLSRRLDAQEAKLDLLLERFTEGAASAGDMKRIGRDMAVALRTPSPQTIENAADPAASHAAGSALPEARTDLQRESSDRAQAVMLAAVSAGRLTDKDRDDLRAVFGNLTPADQGELLRQYSQAVNQDKLPLDPAGPMSP